MRKHKIGCNFAKNGFNHFSADDIRNFVYKNRNEILSVLYFSCFMVRLHDGYIQYKFYFYITKLLSKLRNCNTNFTLMFTSSTKLL